jgi:CRISPR-associated protein Cmr3
MDLFIRPADVWLFRDGRSFDAGSDHRAVSIFPPFPTVMQGVLRSHHLAVKGINLADKEAVRQTVGTAADFGKLRVRGPFLAKAAGEGIKLLFPVPASAVITEDGLVGLHPRPRPDVVTSAPTTELLWPTTAPSKDEPGGWVTGSALTSILKGKAAKAVEERCLFATESRVGIGVDSARGVTGEGNIFEVDFIRPLDGVGLAMQVEGLDGWPKTGLLRMGGESRAGYFSQISGWTWTPPPNPLPPRFQIYFATPTFFAEGWRPATWQRFFEGDVSLVAAAVSRYQSMGGRDVAQNTDKPARRFVPAGSVYFFRTAGKARLKPGLLQQSITDFGAEIGFGQIIVEGY